MTNADSSFPNEPQNESREIISALQEKVCSLETILDSMHDGFFTLDKNLNFTYINKAFEKICHCRKEDFIGTNYWEQFPKAKSLKFYDEYTRALQEQVDVHFEEYATSLHRWVSVNVYPSQDGLSVYFIDITERRNAVLLIEAQNERLREIAWIQSHKVRGPLASILGLASMLNNESPTDVDHNKVISGVLEACKQLDGVIKEIDEQTKVIDKT